MNMKLIVLLIILHFAKADFFDSLSSRVKNLITNDDDSKTSEEENYKIPDIKDLFTNRTEDYCSFTKLEDNNEGVPDPEECQKINERFKNNSNFDFISYFGELFNELKTGIDSIKFPNNGNKMMTIFFVGNTGSGKSTLVQILGGDNKKIFSKTPNEDSTDFIIVDDSKIGVDTVTSQTLYPELLVDPKTGYVLCDNPGFRDTRSPVHEIIAVYGMRKVLERTKKVKVVIVSTHASLKVGMYRDDFPNLLKHVTDFFYQIEKYKDSIYLIGTKVENTATLVKGQPVLVSDSSIIAGTAHFLKQVRNSMSQKNNLFNITSTNKDAYFKKSIEIIDSLLKTDGGVNSKINILRRPAEEGPLSDISIIQEEREKIRDSLLNDKDMIEVKDGDFGFPLTDSAVVYLNEIFVKMNTYVTKLSGIIGEYIMTHYENLIDSITDINEMMETTGKMKRNLRNLSIAIGQARNPGEYAGTISSYSEKNKLNLECLTTFKNIFTLNEYLTNLEDLSNTTKYTPLSWNTSMRKISDFIETKAEQADLLNEVLKISSSYDFQKDRHSILQRDRTMFEVNEENFDKFLTQNNFKRFSSVTPDQKLIYNINEIYNTALQHKQYEPICENNTLVFTGYFILLSELNHEEFEICKNYSRIVISALNTVFIDQDLIGDRFEGKDLTIIAPVWEVIGSRTISVDGTSGGVKSDKAGYETLGKSGKSGKPGGNFAGIGMNFKNGYSLKISACGGDGQDGQDGGDGRDGSSGRNGNAANAEEVESKPSIYVLVNFNEKTSVAKGSSGLEAGDAGAGGVGGYGGKKGTAVVYDIGDEPHHISITAEDGKRGTNGRDGKPGKGSVKGCDKVVKETTTYILFLPVSKSTNADFVNCGQEIPGGTIRRGNEMPKRDDTSVVNNDSPVCIHIMDFQTNYLKDYSTHLSDGITRKFIKAMKLHKY